MKKYLIGTCIIFVFASVIGGAVGYAIYTAKISQQSNTTVSSLASPESSITQDPSSTNKTTDKKMSTEEQSTKIKELTASPMQMKNDDMKDLTIYSYELSSSPGIYLSPYIVVENKTKKVTLRDFSVYLGESWIFYDTVYIKTDNNTYQINYTHTGNNQDVYPGGVFESYDIVVEDKMISALEDISNSNTTKVRFTGKYSSEKILSKEEISHIKNIIKLYHVLKQ